MLGIPANEPANNVIKLAALYKFQINFLSLFPINFQRSQDRFFFAGKPHLKFDT